VKVCFFSPTAYAYFRPDASTWAGGAEMQQVLVARRMLEKGIEVSFIVGDHGQAEVETAGGVTLIRSFRPFAGNRKLRFLPDMLSIRRAMRIADADVYNQRSTSFFTGQMAWFAARLGRAFTFSVGIDYNVYPDCQGLLPRPLAALYRWGIRRADAVIAQTVAQQALMATNFGRDIELIRNGVPFPSEPEQAPPAAPEDPPVFLWVGRSRWTKRPELLVELARRIPQARFVFICSRAADDDYHRSVIDAVRATPNVRHIEFVPPDEIDAYYRRAFALINTSSMEGFPNTYLHAWAHGAPVLTIEIDPDGAISRYGLGLVGGTLEGLAAAVRSLLGDRDLRARLSRNAATYVRVHHDIADRGDDYSRLFERIVARRRANARP